MDAPRGARSAGGLNEAVGEAVARVRWSRLSESARSKLLLSLLANLSVAAAGVEHAYLPHPAAGARFTLLDGAATDSARDAATFNAAVMHARTQDDFHPPAGVHLGAVVTPAALAVAERDAADGRTLLSALAAGCTAAAGVGRATAPATTPQGFRSTAIYGPFGASAAAAVAAGFDAERIGDAVALSAAWCAGLTQCWLDGSDEWQVHVGLAAAGGVLATELVAAGLRAAPGAFDGRSGLTRAFAGTELDREAFVAGFDPEATLRELVLKRYPVSGKCQAPVALLVRLVQQHGLTPDAVTQVDVALHPVDFRHPGSQNRGPFRSVAAALMSVPFCLAVVLGTGALVLRDLYALDHPGTHSLLPRIVLHEDASVPKLGCRITVQAGAACHEDAVADFEDELSITWDTVDAWARPLWQEGGWPAERYGLARAAVLALAEAPDARALTAAFADPAPRTQRKVHR